MRRYIGRFRLPLLASLATVCIGCVSTWEEYRDSRGAGKADAEVAIFKAHLDNTRRIVSASDERIEYQYDPAQARKPWFAAHPIIRLLPGQYTITAKTWPFGSLYRFEVDLKAGHRYKVETYLCNFECRTKGNPYRHDRWIEDLTTRERISGVVSECYMEIPRRRERRKVPCPDEEDFRDSGSAGKAIAAVAKDEKDDRDSHSAGKAIAAVAKDEKDDREPHSAGIATAALAKDEEDDRDSRSAGIATAAMAKDEGDDRDSRSAVIATAAVAKDEEDDRDSHSAVIATEAVAKDEEDDRESHGAGKADGKVAIFKAHLINTRRIVSASGERIEYLYNPERKRTPRSDPYQLIQLLPGQYTITAKTWPFGSMYEFEVDLKAGHVYKVETFLCNLDCISTGEPYRHDRWVQDLTTGERISDIVSECYLGKKRQRDRRRVPCPDI